MRAGAGAIVLAMALAGASFADDAATTTRAHPELTGHWVLNEKASELPHFGGGRGGPGGGMRGEGAGGWSGGHGGGRRGNGGGGDGARPEARGGMMLPNDMVVELYDDTLMVSERGLAVRKLAFGGGQAAPPAAASGAQAGGPPVIAAHWDQSRVVSQIPGRRGGTVDEIWELSKDGQQLVVKTELPAMGDRPGFEIKRVYDRVE